MAEVRKLCCVPSPRGWVAPSKVAGHTVGRFEPAMLYVEGGLGKAVGASGLVAAGVVADAYVELVDKLRAAGVPVPAGYAGRRRVGFAGVRRLDGTVNLRAPSEAIGLTVLDAIAAVAKHAGRVKGEVIWSTAGQVETVYWRGYGGRRKLARWYDKGVESGAAARGELIRGEDQRRFPMGKRLPLEIAACPNELRERFVKRFEALWRASGTVRVANSGALVRSLAEMELSGEISSHQFVRLAGYLDARREGLLLPRRTERRYRAELRELGLHESGGTLRELEIDLHEILEAAMDRETWGADG